jgi:PAS domain S-box-containing protein/putative nucleotidyltransferase with HDIG domain
MSWLLPSLISVLAGTILLAITYAYLYFQERHRHVGIWALSWTLYAVRFAFELVAEIARPQPALTIAAQLAALSSGLVLLWGTLVFTRRKLSRAWLAIVAAGSAWVVISAIFRFNFTWLTLPTFFFLGAIYIWTGFAFLHHPYMPGAGQRITAWAFILWGIHKANFPFLRPVVWFAPWGYLIGSVLEFVVAIGMLLIYFQSTRHQLSEREARLRAIFDNAAIGVGVVDPAGNFIQVNEYLCRLLGYTRDELLAANCLAMTYPDDLPLSKHTQERLIRGELNQNLAEKRFIRKDGLPIWVSLSSSAVCDEQGRLVSVIGMLVDISSRKQNELGFEKHLAQLEILHSIDQAINGGQDLKAIFDTLLEGITTRLGVSAADLLLVDQPTLSYTLLTGRGFKTTAFRSVNLRMGQGFASQAVLGRRPVHLREISPAPGERSVFPPSWKDEAFRQYLAFPIITETQVRGVLEVFLRDEAEPEWIDFIETMVEQGAIAIEKFSLTDRLHRSNLELNLAYDLTLEGWAKALELRDKETKNHSQHVTAATLALARELGCSEGDLVHIRRGALLHDIGKMGVPDNILLKPGPLTEAEWEIMREHPVRAFELLSPIPYLHAALDIPYCHHERWNGSGYPRGLAGGQIPLAARIFAVVDVWDALISDRPYRPAWSSAQATAYLLEQRGILFDPQVVDRFIAMFEVDEAA